MSISTASIFLASDETIRTRILGPHTDNGLYSLALGHLGAPATFMLHLSLDQLDALVGQLTAQHAMLGAQLGGEATA